MERCGNRESVDEGYGDRGACVRDGGGKKILGTSTYPRYRGARIQESNNYLSHYLSISTDVVDFV